MTWVWLAAPERGHSQGEHQERGKEPGRVIKGSCRGWRGLRGVSPGRGAGLGLIILQRDWCDKRQWEGGQAWGTQVRKAGWLVGAGPEATRLEKQEGSE